MINLVVKSVRVGRKHIDKGICGNVEKCAVAQALADVAPGYHVHVTGSHAEFVKVGGSKQEQAAKIELPMKVQRFIDRFDSVETSKNGYEPTPKALKSRRAALKTFTFVTAVPYIA